MAPVHEFILGGQRSGKSRLAEERARQWLAASPAHQAVFVATAQAWDAEMQARILRHQRDRAERLPGMLTLEAPRALSEAIAQHSRADTLVVVDCLTLWLTHWLMPVEPVDARRAAPDADALADSLCATVRDAPGPLVLVGNEIGLGVIPLGREVRAFVDALGRLNQAMAATCGRVTWMAAGLPMPLKVPAA